MKNILLLIVTAVIILIFPNVNFGQAPDLGTTSDFALFTAVGAFDNTGATLVTGDVGTNVGAFNAFPPGTLVGAIHVADAISAQAAIDVDAAYSELSAVSCGSVIGVGLGSGQELLPGVYCTGAASTLSGNLILNGNGDPDALFIIKIGGAFSTSTFSTVTLINSASLSNVYWQINGAFDLGDNSVFNGTIVANGAITLLESSTLFGRGLSRGGAISLHNNIVNVGMQPTASIISASGSTIFCEGSSVILSGNIDGTWNNGSTTPSITVNTSGDYFVTNTNAFGSVSSNHIPVTVNPQPTASTISANGPTTFCEGDSVILSGNNGGVWNTGELTPSITVKTSGDYFVTNTNACGSVSSNHISVTEDPLPIASTISASGSTTFCEGDSVILSGNNGGTWNNGATTPSITVKTSGDYFVTNTNACGSVSSNIISVAVDPLPTASTISASGLTTFCEGDSVILSGNNGGVWSNGATTPSITVNISGDYFVTNTNACGSVNSNHIPVTVNPLPVGSGTIGADTVCQGQSGVVYSIPVIANATDYIWTLPVGATITAGANTNSVIVDFSTTASSGDITVQGSNSCGTGIVSSNFPVTVTPLPIASVISASGSTTFCEGNSVVLSGNNGGTWSNGATTSSITVTTSGDYFVTNTTACGSVTSNHIPVTVNPQPIASTLSASGSTTFFDGDSVILSGNNGGTWSNGATTSSITVTTSGDYFVTNTNACGSVTSNHIPVTVNPGLLPIASIISANGPTTFCEGDSVILSGNNGGVWNNGATSSSITVNASGDYFVTNTNAYGSSTSNQIEVVVNPQPIASTISANGSTTFCEGDSVILSGNNGGVWNNGATTPSITVTTSGDYFVTNTNICGSDTSNHIPVTVNPQPTASTLSASGPTTFFDGDSVILSGNNGGTWNNGATTPSITVTTSGDYFVTNTNTCGSVTSNHIPVIVNPGLLPIASIISANGPTIFCEGDSVILSGNNGGVWNNGATTPSITVTTSGDYFVTTTNAFGSVTSNLIQVTVNPLPTAAGTIVGSDTVCQGQTGVVYSVPAITNATDYIWTLPVGAIITAGANTNTITVNYSNIAESGNITVQGSNDCGNGAVSPNYAVTITSLPGAAGVITGSAGCK